MGAAAGETAGESGGLGLPRVPAERPGVLRGVGGCSPAGAGGRCPRRPARPAVTGRFDPTAKLARFQSEIPEEI